MNDLIYRHREETLLIPENHQISIEVFLLDTKHLMTKNGYGEVYFTFTPLTPTDWSRLEEALASAVSEVMMKKSPDSRKEPRGYCEVNGSKGKFFCNQLFIPKLNYEPDHYSQLYGKKADLNLFFRDDPDGLIYLQCGYVDLFETLEDNSPTVTAYATNEKVDYDF